MDVLVFGNDDGSDGRGTLNNKMSKVSQQHLLAILEYVDLSHSKGKVVTVKKIRNHLTNVHSLEVSRTQVRYSMKKLGLRYKPVQSRRRNMNTFRPERIREYLIEYDKTQREIDNGKDWVFVYTDESYVHQSHSTTNSYFVNGRTCEINRSGSKGRRLIILHAITNDGPLAETDPVTQKPALGKLKWTGDTPHPVLREDGLLTCETLWPADTHTGDYHNNMCSDMFMQWAEQRLLPTFKRKFPGIKMVLVLDNAPYHHKRSIGSLQKVTKKELLKMMWEDDVDEIELPWTDARWELFNQ